MTMVIGVSFSSFWKLVVLPQAVKKWVMLLGHRSHTRISYDSLRLACDRLSHGIFNLARIKKMRNSPLVTHYFQVNQCEDSNTLQLNQPHKQYSRAPIYITAKTQSPHKSDYGRRLIEVPSSLCFQVCSVCTVTP